MLKQFIFIFFIFLFGNCSSLFSQSIWIKGKVTEENTGLAIPFANLIVVGTQTGCSSDSMGRFQFAISSGRKRDTIVVSAIGYETEKIPILPIADQFITIELKSTIFNLKEATIRPGENPAWRILRKVIANKAANNPLNCTAYEYEAYHKVEFDMNNFTEKIKKNIFLRSFDFVFENADTTADGVNYLPILLTESTSELYYRKNPITKKELVKGRRSVGIKGPKIMKFAEDMYIAPDIYNEYVVILDKNFPSPINDNYKLNYRFYLLDSALVGGKQLYYIQFKPKRKEDVAFTGEMYIEDSSFVVKQINLEFSITANVNFVRNYWIHQEYNFVDDKHAMLTKSQVIGDFTVVENSKEMTGFFGKKTSTYKNFKMDLPRDDNFYKQLDRVTFDDSSSIREELFWQTARSEALSKQEKSIVTMMDTLEKQKEYNLLKNSIKSITSGWIPWKQIEIGDFYTFYSYNDVEKSRVKIGLRAQHLFNNRFSFKTYLAYGSFDERFKYLAEAKIILTRKRAKETRIGGKLLYDANQPGRSTTIFPIDHVVNSITNLGSFNNRNLVRNYEGFIERQWLTGFTTRFVLTQSIYTPFGAYDYVVKYDDQITYLKPSYTNSGFQVSMRFAYGERNLSANFGDGMRGTSFPKVPVLSLHYEKGMQDFLKGEFKCDKIKLRIEEKFRLAKLGYTLARVEGGKTWGILPYNLLETPTANPIIINDETAFNLMNYMEFIGDQYFSIMLEHHFEGLFLNKIPLLKKLKWRELILAKLYAGNLSEQNKNSIYVIPSTISYLNEPYIEVGFGIENIFKFSRVDFLWRLNYKDKAGVYKFIAKPVLQFKF